MSLVMTIEQLVAKGRALMRPGVFFGPEPRGAVMAYFYAYEVDEGELTQRRP